MSERWEKYRDKVYQRLGWLGAFLVIFGYYLNANMMVSSWLVWAVGNAMVGAYSLSKKAYPTVVMSLIIMIMNVYGYFNWGSEL